MLPEYERKKGRLIAELSSIRDGPVRLGKRTSNLFRRRAPGRATIDVRDFNQVLSIDPDRLVAEVEGMTTYEALVRETLAPGFMPAVVPELKSITVGGSIAGLAIESSSFKHGLVHETVTEMEVLLGDGSTVVCSADENADLFYGFPNTYGTLGYVLKATIGIVPVKPYVRLDHERFDDPTRFFRAVEEVCSGAVDFVDGTIFGEREMVLTTGRFSERAEDLSDYTYLDVYYQSIRRKPTDWLTVADYLWRWDTDWFWCSKHFGLQHRLLRRLLGRRRLKSTTYWAIMNLNRRLGLTRVLEGLGRTRRESVIQDVEVPLERAEAFLDFFHAEIGIRPIWMCPTRTVNPASEFDFCRLHPDTLWINFGFWDTVETSQPDGWYNRKIEARVRELGGMKSLYSDSYYSEDEFWSLFDRVKYERLKAKYDPGGALLGLYEKCACRQ